MGTYAQLTEEQRYYISVRREAGCTQAEIVEVHPLTISRELARNRRFEGGYDPKQAHKRTVQRPPQEKSHPRIFDEVRKTVAGMLEVFWSPQQISGWLRQNTSMRISHEWIYQFVIRNKSEDGKLHEHFRLRRKRRKRYGSPQRRGQIPDQVSISERPAVVVERSRVGDWEVDTIIGAQHCGALVSLVQRKSRLIRLAFVPRRTADNVNQAVIHLLKQISDRVHTLTADNGKEFAGHEDIARLAGCGLLLRPPVCILATRQLRECQWLDSAVLPEESEAGWCSPE